MSVNNERIQFRLFSMPCCGQLLCWVNPRIPNHCPECGQSVYMTLRQESPENIRINDPNAWLKYHEPQG